MDSYKLAQELVKINELIESGNITEAEQSLIQLKGELVEDNSQEELSRLDIFWTKIENLKKATTDISSSELTERDLLSMMLKGQKLQNELLKNMEWYLKFFFWLTVIGLILIFLSWLL